MKEKLRKYKEIILFTLDLIICILRNLFGKKIKKIKFKTSTNVRKINILGNGPSGLETLYKREVLNTDLATVNFFIKTDEFYLLKPKFHYLIDPLFFAENSIIKNEVIEIIKKMEDFVDWKLNLLVMTSEIIEFKNKNIEVIYLKNNSLDYENKIAFKLFEKNIATPYFINVVIAAIYYSINLGYSEISLHGVESDSFKDVIVDKNCNVLLEDRHFYGKKTINLTKEGRIPKGKLYKKIECDYKMLYNYYILEKYSKYKKVKIYNYCLNSMIDSFKKIED